MLNAYDSFKNTFVSTKRFAFIFHCHIFEIFNRFSISFFFFAFQDFFSQDALVNGQDERDAPEGRPLPGPLVSVLWLHAFPQQTHHQSHARRSTCFRYDCWTLTGYV
jgi:hypothetical protein